MNLLKYNIFVNVLLHSYILFKMHILIKTYSNFVLIIIFIFHKPEFNFRYFIVSDGVSMTTEGEENETNI